MTRKPADALFSIFAVVILVLVAVQAVDGFREVAAPPAPPVAMSPVAGGGGGGGAVDLPIAKFMFPAGEVKVPVGTTARWTNTDGARHTVSATDGSFDSGKLVKDQTFEHTFTTAGTYAYACLIHASMQATITVT